MFEFIIWGIPPGKKEEEILSTKSKNPSQARRYKTLLEEKYNCRDCRIQVINLESSIKSNDFIKAIKI